MQKENLLISSCLIGLEVKYNGKSNILDKNILQKLKDKYNIINFCPEVEGGLPIPRTPCEIITINPLKILNKNNENKTKEFLLGANKTLQLCKKHNIKKAILKANSPSCGNEKVYDGTFLGKKIDGLGVTANLLKNNQILVYNEEQIKELL